MSYTFITRGFFIMLIAALMLLAMFTMSLSKNNAELKEQNHTYLIQIDSLKAENSITVSQLHYLEKFYDSSKNKIPQPRGFAFISDTVINTKK